MPREKFHRLVVGLTRQLSGRPLDAGLEHWLNRHHGPGSPLYEALREGCMSGVAGGWLCEREAAGIRYGRAFQAADALHRFSVDVVDMNNAAAPHHQHPQGEICLIIPLDGTARFDGHCAGWCVYGTGSAHSPTVTGGRALVLYLLPEGLVEFSRKAA
jgi:hypothetical protein